MLPLALLALTAAVSDTFTEGPVFDTGGNIYFSNRTSILKLSAGGQLSTWIHDPDAGFNGHKILPDGTHLICAAKRGAVLRYSQEGRPLGAASKECDGKPLRAPNDITLDRLGGFYFTDPGGSREAPIGTVHYAGPDGITRLAAGGMRVPNGLVLTPNGKFLYVSETVANRVLRFPVHAPGKLGNMEIFATLPTREGHAAEPDGLAVDQSGNLYVAHLGTGSVRVLNPQGRLTGTLPAGIYDVSNLVFGPGDQQLFITGSTGHRSTTPGRLMRLDLPLLALSAPAIEIATGKMLGPPHEARSFYTRSGNGPWTRTYSGPAFRPEAAGRLMNLRIAQALFDDEWLTEEKFDPEANTTRVIKALDTYKAHGILSINTSLQGGNMQYELHPTILRGRDHKLGPGKGSLVSAFRPDGSLKPEWMARCLRLQRALDSRGMILNLTYFYFGQDEVLENGAAIDEAVRNATDWLIDNNCRNVIIEIANEHDIQAYDHNRYIHTEIGKLIQLARSRFSEKKAPFRLPISASSGGSMRVFDGTRENADLTAIHGNNKTPEFKKKRVAELHADPAMPGPIFMNEDNNGRDTTPENLAIELAACEAVFHNGGSWGYMPWRQLQIFPFGHIEPGKASRVTADMPVEQRDPAYFKAVLEHIRKLVYR